MNGRIVNIPSFIVKPGDVITIGERSKKSPMRSKPTVEVAKNRRASRMARVLEDGDASAKVLAVAGPRADRYARGRTTHRRILLR